MRNNIFQEEFIELYKKERPLYKMWGEYVCEYVKNKAEEKYINIDKIFKVPPTYRTKEIESLVEKAFFRNKQYQDPYNDITDKVGVRFVVMCESQIDGIKEIIESCKQWSFSKDVDYHVLREKNPDVFSYQSIHYIVKNTESIRIGDQTIPKGLSCEIQLRTLEQHAYAEISHDLVYKRDIITDKNIMRLLARTAAFNEESDSLFCEMYSHIEEQEQLYNSFMQELKKQIPFQMKNDKLNRVILNFLKK